MLYSSTSFGPTAGSINFSPYPTDAFATKIVLSTFRVVDAFPTNANDVTFPVTHVNPAVTFVAHLLGGAAAASGGGGGEIRSAASANLRVASRISFSIA